MLEFLEEYASRAVGVDISPDMIAYAKKRVKKAELIVADLTKHDVLAGQRFDMITAFRIFLNAGPELSDEIINVLMPKLGEDGVFIFNFHGNILSYRIFTKLWFMLWGRRLNTISYWSALGFAGVFNQIKPVLFCKRLKPAPIRRNAEYISSQNSFELVAAFRVSSKLNNFFLD